MTKKLLLLAVSMLILLSLAFTSCIGNKDYVNSEDNFDFEENNGANDSNNNEGGNANNNSSSDNDDNNSNSTDNIAPGNGDNTDLPNNKDEVEYMLSIPSGEFIDGRMWIGYYSLNSTKSDYPADEYTAFIDEEGNVLYWQFNSDGPNKIYNIGGGTGIITSSSDCKIIGSDGSVIKILDKPTEVLLYGGGFAFLYQNNSTLTSVEHLYGIIDHNGNWIKPLEDYKAADLLKDFTYAGDSIFYKFEHDWDNDKNIYSIINLKSLKCTTVYTPEYNSYGKIENGVAYFQIDKPEYIDENEDEESYTVYVKTDDSEEKLNDDFILKADGTVIPIETPKHFNDGKAAFEKDGYLYFVDYSTATQKNTSFTKYTSSMIDGIEFNGDYALLQLLGADGKRYFSLINLEGEEMYDPIVEPRGAKLYKNGFVRANGSDYIGFYDKEGNRASWHEYDLATIVEKEFVGKGTSFVYKTYIFMKYEIYTLDGKEFTIKLP